MAAGEDKEEWRTFTAKLRKADYDFVQAVLKRVADAERVMPGTALHLIIQDWILAVENHGYNPDVESS